VTACPVRRWRLFRGKSTDAESEHTNYNRQWNFCLLHSGICNPRLERLQWLHRRWHSLCVQRGVGTKRRPLWCFPRPATSRSSVIGHARCNIASHGKQRASWPQAPICICTVGARENARRLLAERSIGHDIHYPILDYDQPAWRMRVGPQSRLPVQGNRVNLITRR
jgi:hypothetical protein